MHLLSILQDLEKSKLLSIHAILQSLNLLGDLIVDVLKGAYFTEIFSPLHQLDELSDSMLRVNHSILGFVVPLRFAGLSFWPSLG